MSNSEMVAQRPPANEGKSKFFANNQPEEESSISGSCSDTVDKAADKVMMVQQPKQIHLVNGQLKMVNVAPTNTGKNPQCSTPSGNLQKRTFNSTCFGKDDDVVSQRSSQRLKEKRLNNNTPEEKNIQSKFKKSAFVNQELQEDDNSSSEAHEVSVPTQRISRISNSTIIQIDFSKENPKAEEVVKVVPVQDPSTVAANKLLPAPPVISQPVSILSQPLQVISQPPNTPNSQSTQNQQRPQRNRASVIEKRQTEEADQQTQDKKRNRRRKVVTNCAHKTAQHYAKGMCNHCYHMFGRKKAGTATVCPHPDRANYCKGMCMNCYINGYNKQKKRNLKMQKAK